MSWSRPRYSTPMPRHPGSQREIKKTNCALRLWRQRREVVSGTAMLQDLPPEYQDSRCSKSIPSFLTLKKPTIPKVKDPPTRMAEVSLHERSIDPLRYFSKLCCVGTYPLPPLYSVGSDTVLCPPLRGYAGQQRWTHVWLLECA